MSKSHHTNRPNKSTGSRILHYLVLLIIVITRIIAIQCLLIETDKKVDCTFHAMNRDNKRRHRIKDKDKYLQEREHNS